MSDRVRITKELLEKANLDYTFEEENLIGMLDNIHKDSWGVVSISLYSSKLVERALEGHAKALILNARATEEHAINLNRATWVLAIATVVLALSTIVLALAAFL